MTGLHRTPLTTSQKTQCAAMALAGQEVHGTISEVSRAFGISRPTLYEARHAAGEVLKKSTSRKRNPHIRLCVLKSIKHSSSVPWWGCV